MPCRLVSSRGWRHRPQVQRQRTPEGCANKRRRGNLPLVQSCTCQRSQSLRALQTSPLQGDLTFLCIPPHAPLLRAALVLSLVPTIRYPFGGSPFGQFRVPASPTILEIPEHTWTQPRVVSISTTLSQRGAENADNTRHERKEIGDADRHIP